MPAKLPAITQATQAQLIRLGQQVRARRKALGVNATVAAEAAGMSRVTWHRIERGEPSVTMGAYGNALGVLGLTLEALTTATHADDENAHQGWIPVRVPLADYPQLKLLAWQVQGVDTLTPIEAFNIYERNARHLDAQKLEIHEQHLIAALQVVFGEGAKHV